MQPLILHFWEIPVQKCHLHPKQCPPLSPKPNGALHRKWSLDLGFISRKAWHQVSQFVTMFLAAREESTTEMPCEAQLDQVWHMLTSANQQLTWSTHNAGSSCTIINIYTNRFPKWSLTSELFCWKLQLQARIVEYESYCSEWQRSGWPHVWPQRSALYTRETLVTHPMLSDLCMNNDPKGSLSQNSIWSTRWNL